MASTIDKQNLASMSKDAINAVDKNIVRIFASVALHLLHEWNI